MAPSVIIIGIYLPLTCTIKIRINGKFILKMLKEQWTVTDYNAFVKERK